MSLTGAPAIRQATPADARAVADCHTLCWRQAYAGLVRDDYLYSATVERRRLSRWRERLAGTRVVWLADDGGSVVGVASTDVTQDHTAPVPVQLMSLYLRFAFQGTGLADRLLRAAVGAKPAFLWVFADNPRARRFYTRNGFVPDGAEMIDPDTGLLEVRMVRESLEISPVRPGPAGFRPIHADVE
jgi:GNAT superfamily N-acetyltransferase